jgi:hypothetical protein
LETKVDIFRSLHLALDAVKTVGDQHNQGAKVPPATSSSPSVNYAKKGGPFGLGAEKAFDLRDHPTPVKNCGNAGGKLKNREPLTCLGSPAEPHPGIMVQPTHGEQ